MDPLESKYPSMSAFNGMGNNPLLFIDPNGKEIVIYYGNNQSYVVGSNKPIPNDDYVKSVMESFKAIRMHDESMATLNELILDKSFVVNIIEGDDNFSPRTSGELPKPSKFYPVSNVYWHPHMGLSSKNSSDKLSPFVALFHELGHANRYRRDLKGGTPQNFLDRMSNTDIVWRNQEEKENIAENEIPLASFFGQLERQDYSTSNRVTYRFNNPIDDGSGGNSKEISQMPIRPATHEIPKDIIAK